MARYDVLIVDDEQDFRDIMAKKLAKRDLNCDSAPDGNTALEMVKAKNYDVVLLDVKMPGMDGIETLREIRALRAETPVLLISGHGSGEILSQFAEERLDGIVQKPFTTPALREALQRALAQPGAAAP